MSSVAQPECASAEKIGAWEAEAEMGIPGRRGGPGCPRGSRPRKQPVLRGMGPYAPGDKALEIATAA